MAARFGQTPFGRVQEYCTMSRPGPLSLEALATALAAVRKGCLWGTRQRYLRSADRKDAFRCAAAATLGERECNADWPEVARLLLDDACEAHAAVARYAYDQAMRDKLLWGVSVKRVP